MWGGECENPAKGRDGHDNDNHEEGLEVHESTSLQDPHNKHLHPLHDFVHERHAEGFDVHTQSREMTRYPWERQSPGTTLTRTHFMMRTSTMMCMRVTVTSNHTTNHQHLLYAFVHEHHAEGPEVHERNSHQEPHNKTPALTSWFSAPAPWGTIWGACDAAGRFQSATLAGRS